MNITDIIMIVLEIVVPLYLGYLIKGLQHEVKSQKEVILTQKETIETIRDKSSEVLELKDIHKKFSEDIYEQTQIYKKIMDEQVSQLRSEAEETQRKLNEYRKTGSI
jgi:hypothetical protein